MSVNKVIIVGNLGSDPDTRTTGNGTVVAKLSIATNERIKRDDQWEDHVEWHKVVCFGTTAENAGRYLRKGRQVYIEGKLRTQKWQDKDGNDRWTTEIVADVVQFLGPKPDGDDRREDRRDDDRGGRRDSGRRDSGRSSGSSAGGEW